MDRLELQPLIMYIFYLDQRIARRMVQPHLRLHFFPDGLGGSQGMVAVAHRKQQNRLICANPIFCCKNLRLRQLVQGRDDLGF